MLQGQFWVDIIDRDDSLQRRRPVTACMNLLLQLWRDSGEHGRFSLEITSSPFSDRRMRAL